MHISEIPHWARLVIMIMLIHRQFLTRRNTTKSLQGRAATQWLMTCHTKIVVSRHISVRSCQWWKGKSDGRPFTGRHSWLLINYQWTIFLIKFWSILVKNCNNGSFYYYNNTQNRMFSKCKKSHICKSNGITDYLVLYIFMFIRCKGSWQHEKTYRNWQTNRKKNIKYWYGKKYISNVCTNRLQLYRSAHWMLTVTYIHNVSYSTLAQILPQ